MIGRAPTQTDFDRALARLGYGRPGDPLTFAELTHGFAPPDGFTARVEAMNLDPLAIRIAYLSPDRRRAATLVRHFEGDGVLRLSLLEVEEPWRGEGQFSMTINGQTLLRCLKWGLRRVVVRAQGFGRHAWAMAGFSFDDPDQAVRAGDAFLDEHPSDVTPEQRQVLRVLAGEPRLLARWDDGRRYDWSFTDDDGTVHSGRAHLGKALLLGRHTAPWDAHLVVDARSAGFITALAAFKVGRRS